MANYTENLSTTKLTTKSNVTSAKPTTRTTTRPRTTTKPKTTTRPRTTTKPKTTTRPRTTTKPKTTTRPRTTTKPKTTTKPQTTTRPKTTTKSSTTTKTTTKTTTTFSICPPGFVFNGTQCEECGLSDVEMNLKIVGGQEATPYSIPSQVFVTFNVYDAATNSLSPYRCGGTLIRPNVVLTAAHCVDKDYKESQYFPTFESSIYVYAGVHDITFFETSMLAPFPGVTLRVSKVIPVFTLNNLNDIKIKI